MTVHCAGSVILTVHFAGSVMLKVHCSGSVKLKVHCAGSVIPDKYIGFFLLLTFKRFLIGKIKQNTAIFILYMKSKVS